MPGPEFDKLVLASRPKATWTDLVLPPSELKALRQIAAAAKAQATARDKPSRGRAKATPNGLTVLFAGASATDRTLAAEVLANELRRPLYRIDLSTVVSKYIGETEKNLELRFDKAEAGDAIVLFDEADALFGKRGDVKDSHDRYANIEVAYLLERMESHRGVVILQSNRKSAIDPAVLRRLGYVIDFPLT
jgi:SpoVK/Ycf46/Vps4 family AAA+-type ATPase